MAPAKADITLRLDLNRETKNTVRYDVADDVDFPDVTSLYINKAAFREYHSKNGGFPPSVNLEVTFN